MLPNFLVIGAPRAGTTWIARNLREHPDIYIPSIKEVHFFDRNYNRGLDYYEGFFNGVSSETAIGEVTPSYLFLPQVPELIKKSLQDVRLIVTLRHPVERLYSRYWNSKAKYSQNKDLSFEEKLGKKPEFIHEGFYYDHLIRYFEIFPRKDILVLFFDELKDSPDIFLKKIFKHLNVDEDYKPPLLSSKINSATSVKNIGKSQVLWQVYRVLKKLRLYRAEQFVEKINRVEYPPMKHETREYLLELYREKNEKLSELLGVDLTQWDR